jgi:hypothetical protein
VVLLRTFMMWNLMKSMVQKRKDENLDDVRGTQLATTMKKLDIGDIRPRLKLKKTKIKCKLVVLMITIKLVHHLKRKIINKWLVLISTK